MFHRLPHIDVKTIFHNLMSAYVMIVCIPELSDEPTFHSLSHIVKFFSFNSPELSDETIFNPLSHIMKLFSHNIKLKKYIYNNILAIHRQHVRYLYDVR